MVEKEQICVSEAERCADVQGDSDRKINTPAVINASLILTPPK